MQQDKSSRKGPRLSSIVPGIMHNKSLAKRVLLVLGFVVVLSLLSAFGANTELRQYVFYPVVIYIACKGVDRLSYKETEDKR